MKIVDVSEGTIDLGKQGEHLAEQVRFPIADIVTEFGEGVFLLLAQRPGDTVTYPVRTYSDTDYVYWNVTGIDTAYPGSGRCELQYFVDNSLVKSITYLTTITSAAWYTVPPRPEGHWHVPHGPHAPKPYPPMPPGPPRSRRGYYSEYEYLPPHVHSEFPPGHVEMAAHDPANPTPFGSLYNPYNHQWNNPAIGWYNDVIIQGALTAKAMKEANAVTESSEAAKNDAETAAQLARQYQADSERYRNGAALAELTVKAAQLEILKDKEELEELADNLLNIIPNYKGVYSNEKTYRMNDIVMFDNVLYWHIGEQETLGVPVTNIDIWSNLSNSRHVSIRNEVLHVGS